MSGGAYAVDVVALVGGELVVDDVCELGHVEACGEKRGEGKHTTSSHGVRAEGDERGARAGAKRGGGGGGGGAGGGAGGREMCLGTGDRSEIFS